MNQKKYTPSHIVSDRIKAEINRLMILQTQIKQNLHLKEYARFTVYWPILAIFLLLSLFAKPKIQFELTLNITLLLTTIGASGVIGSVAMQLYFTRHDREAKRKVDNAQAEYLIRQKEQLVKS